MIQEQFAKIMNIIKHSWSKSIKVINTELITLYWLVGECIFKRVVNVEWGQFIVKQLADFIQQTEPDLKGYSNKNLCPMGRCYKPNFMNYLDSLMNKNYCKRSNLLIASKQN